MCFAQMHMSHFDCSLNFGVMRIQHISNNIAEIYSLRISFIFSKFNIHNILRYFPVLYPCLQKFQKTLLIFFLIFTAN